MSEPQTSISQPSRDEFAALLEESLTGAALVEGSVVKGTVVSIEKDVAIIDVGLKTEGRVPLKEFGAAGAPSTLSEGDEVDVYLERVENAADARTWRACRPDLVFLHSVHALQVTKFDVKSAVAVYSSYLAAVEPRPPSAFCFYLVTFAGPVLGPHVIATCRRAFARRAALDLCGKGIQEVPDRPKLEFYCAHRAIDHCQ